MYTTKTKNYGKVINILTQVITYDGWHIKVFFYDFTCYFLDFKV